MPRKKRKQKKERSIMVRDMILTRKGGPFLYTTRDERDERDDWREDDDWDWEDPLEEGDET
jgi:hypothetical protein